MHLYGKILQQSVKSSVSVPVQESPASLSEGRACRVPEASFKEPLPYTLSPIGLHISSPVKDKIVKSEFIDILSLLPAAK